MKDWEYIGRDHKQVIGVDEVGRGPLAGPVVSCAVSVAKNFNKESFENFFSDLGITDSKKLSDSKRKKILTSLGIKIGNLKKDKVYEIPKLSFFDLNFVLCECNESEIDELNILNASLTSMRKCVKRIKRDVRSTVLIDGNKFLDMEIDSLDEQTIIKGDSKCVLIGLASIIAKVYRDNIMDLYDSQYPEYGFIKHSGYPTKLHKDAIEKFGPTPIHRKSFKGVKEFIQT